jgi:hypothetical protein
VVVPCDFALAKLQFIEEEKMLNKIVILMLGVVLYCGGLVRATDFYSDATIQDNDIYNTVRVYNTATINMIGGEVGGLYTLDASVLNVSGSSLLGDLSLANTSTANLRGGTIGLVEALDQSIVNIYGYGFTPTPYGTADLLSGFWADNNPFTIQLRRTHLPDVHYVLHEVPEPGSFLLFTIAYVYLRKKR